MEQGSSVGPLILGFGTGTGGTPVVLVGAVVMVVEDVGSDGLAPTLHAETRTRAAYTRPLSSRAISPPQRRPGDNGTSGTRSDSRVRRVPSRRHTLAPEERCLASSSLQPVLPHVVLVQTRGPPGGHRAALSGGAGGDPRALAHHTSDPVAASGSGYRASGREDLPRHAAGEADNR